MPSEEKQATPGPSSGESASETTPLLSSNDQMKMESDGTEVIRKKALSTLQTAFLIAGAMAGPGVLALPHSLVRMGWWGVPVIAGVCAAAAFAGKRLADCRAVLEERNTTPRAGGHSPYSDIVYAALGPVWGAVSAACILVALVGAGAVYLLLAAQLLYNTFLSLTTITYCMSILIVTLAVCPYEFFGTPKDLNFIGECAFLSTLVATVLYFIQILLDAEPFPVFRYGLHGFSDFFLAFGVILFAFAGGSTLPVLQSHMADRTQFYKSINYSFAALLCLYLTIAVTAYQVYGEFASPNIVSRMSPTSLTMAGSVFMIINLLCAFVIIINPVCQEMEGLYKVSRDSLGWRIVVRGCIMLSVLFCATSVPRFQTLVALIGAAPVAILSFVLPIYCYMKLCSRTNDTAATSTRSEDQASDQNWLYKVCGAVLMGGIICGILATFTAVVDVYNTVPTKACYIK